MTECHFFFPHPPLKKICDRRKQPIVRIATAFLAGEGAETGKCSSRRQSRRSDYFGFQRVDRGPARIVVVQIIVTARVKAIDKALPPAKQSKDRVSTNAGGRNCGDTASSYGKGGEGRPAQSGTSGDVLRHAQPPIPAPCQLIR